MRWVNMMLKRIRILLKAFLVGVIVLFPVNVFVHHVSYTIGEHSSPMRYTVMLLEACGQTICLLAFVATLRWIGFPSPDLQRSKKRHL
jgi:hypothetical protein